METSDESENPTQPRDRKKVEITIGIPDVAAGEEKKGQIRFITTWVLNRAEKGRKKEK